MFSRESDVGPRGGTIGFARAVGSSNNQGNYDPTKDLLTKPVRLGALDAMVLPSVINGVRQSHTSHVETVTGKIEINDNNLEENDL
jgi:hypothetical protein